MFNDDEIAKIIDNLILEGGIEIAGIDPETNEMLYTFTPKVKELMPELYDDHLNFINMELMMLWEKGYVEIDFFQDDPLISLSAKSYDQNEVDKLSKEEKWSLKELKRTIESEEF
jgi:hypothetical protein